MMNNKILEIDVLEAEAYKERSRIYGEKIDAIRARIVKGEHVSKMETIEVFYDDLIEAELRAKGL